MKRACCVLAALTQSSSLIASTLPEILESNELRVGVINSPVADTIGRTGYQGENIALAKGFADYLGVQITVRHFYQQGTLQQALENNSIDIASPLVVPDTVPMGLTTGPIFQHRKQIQVNLPTNTAPCTPTRLNLNEESVETALQHLGQQTKSCVILPQRWFTQLKPLVGNHLSEHPVAEHMPHQWLLSETSTALRAALFDFSHRSRVNGSLPLALTPQTILRALEGPLPTRQFIAHSQQHINTIKATFSFPGQTYPWHVLAAISYADNILTGTRPLAESNPLAPFVMPENMTTPLSLERPYSQSQLVQALDSYLATLSRKLPAKLQQPDKRLILLAAYVLGLEHLTDAIALTQQRGAAPFLWANVKQQVALLHSPDVYQNTRYGYANGYMAVKYVDWVTHFSDTLQVLEKQN